MVGSDSSLGHLHVHITIHALHFNSFNTTIIKKEFELKILVNKTTTTTTTTTTTYLIKF